MKNILIDSNIFLYYLKDERQIVDYFEVLKKFDGLIFYSFITKLEILGVPNLMQEEAEKIENMLTEFSSVDYNSQIDLLTLNIRKQKYIKIPDAIISASAIFTDSILVTRNIKDFQNIPKLKLINPFEIN